MILLAVIPPLWRKVMDPKLPGFTGHVVGLNVPQ
jgi:hypothetical protein